MRLFLISGFGEDEFIFDKIYPHLPGEKIFLNPWHLVDDEPRADLNVLEYAAALVKKFDIKSDDVVIGHSTGGWVALHIKHLVKCPIVQISSWTDTRKVTGTEAFTDLAYWLSKKGLLFNRITKHLLLWGRYRHKPSAPIFSSIFDRLRKGDKNNVNNQLRLIFNPVPETVTVQPDLRIHARADTVVRYPDESFHEVPGDHFSLYTYPEKVYKPILELLKTIAVSG
jgi:hypothetical protein